MPRCNQPEYDPMILEHNLQTEQTVPISPRLVRVALDWIRSKDARQTKISTFPGTHLNQLNGCHLGDCFLSYISIIIYKEVLYLTPQWIQYLPILYILKLAFCSKQSNYFSQTVIWSRIKFSSHSFKWTYNLNQSPK